MWEREAEFKQLLSKCTAKASKGVIDSLTQLAIEDHALVRHCCMMHHSASQRHGSTGEAILLHAAWLLSAKCNMFSTSPGHASRAAAQQPATLAQQWCMPCCS